MNELDKWNTFFENEKIKPSQRQLFLDYIDRLLKNDVPIIFEYNHLATLLGFETSELAKISINTQKAYRSFTIPKKKGGVREITSPYPSLAHCQRWIYHYILKKIDFGEYSYAFREGRSIIDNAKVHLGCEELIKIDIKDFFGSITLRRVISIFKNLGYTNLLSFHLASLCCYNDHLPQGACTSPALSNIIAKRIDRRLSRLSQKLNLQYSRYADDIAFSGSRIHPNLLKTIQEIIEDEGFFLNKKKTLMKKKGQKKIITGISITGDSLRVPKKYRREFRKDFYYLQKNGVLEYNGEKGHVDPFYIDRLIGKAHFILTIEDSNQYVLKALSELRKMRSLDQ